MTRFKHHVGRAAATTLGYITGNVPGAFAGYKAYRKFEDFSTKNMPTRRTSRGRSRTRTPKRRRSGTRRRTNSRTFGRSRSTANTTVSQRSRIRSRSLFRRSRSRNTFRSRSSNSLESIQGQGQHHDLSKVHFKLQIGRPSRRMRSFGRYIYGHTVNGMSISAEGLQAAKNLFAIGAQNQLNGTPTINRNAQLQWARNIYDLNPYKLVSGSGLFTAGTPPADNDALYLQNIYGKLEITNNTTCSVLCDLYFVTPRRGDMANDPITTWSSIITNEALGQAVFTQPTLTTTTTAAAGATSVTVPGEKPGLHKTFKTMWRTLQKYEITLQPGDTRIVGFDFIYNKLIRKEWIDERTSPYLSGLTAACFLISRGAPVAIGDPDTPTTEMTYAASKIGYICNYNVVCKAIPVTRVSTQSVQVSQVGGTHQEKMIIDTDVVATVTNA